jgi:hypothetical protein
MSLFRSRDASDDPTAHGGPAAGDDPVASGDPDPAPLPEAEVLRPLSNELISAVLDTRQYQYFTDSDGDIGGHWDDNLIYFFRLGQGREMLQVRVMARRVFNVDDVLRLYAFCNGWNHDKLWPKAYVHVADDGSAGIYGEVTTDLERGVTLGQLDQLIACGISTGCALAEAVADLP